MHPYIEPDGVSLSGIWGKSSAPCVRESWTNVVSKICWVFVGGIWPNFHY